MNQSGTTGKKHGLDAAGNSGNRRRGTGCGWRWPAPVPRPGRRRAGSHGLTPTPFEWPYRTDRWGRRENPRASPTYCHPAARSLVSAKLAGSTKGSARATGCPQAACQPALGRRVLRASPFEATFGTRTVRYSRNRAGLTTKRRRQHGHPFVLDARDIIHRFPDQAAEPQVVTRLHERSSSLAYVPPNRPDFCEPAHTGNSRLSVPHFCEEIHGHNVWRDG
jgi:hypothetical protein